MFPLSYQPDRIHRRTLASDHGLACFAAVDASVTKDTTAMALVGFDRSTEAVYLLDHKIITPTAAKPIDFAVIEQIILDRHVRFKLKACFYDSYQMVATAQKLALHYVPVKEYSPTHSINQMTENFMALVKHHRLVMYRDQQIREAVANCVLAEEARGALKIAERHKTDRIDIIIALAIHPR